VANNAIMDKTFFVVVPYDPVYIPQAAKGLMGFVKKAIPGQQEGSPTSQKKDESENLQQNLQQLRQRVDQAIAGLQQIGLRAIPLDTEESIELIYNLYNPQMIERGNLEIAKE
jgi:hypothetical protein